METNDPTNLVEIVAPVSSEARMAMLDAQLQRARAENRRLQRTVDYYAQHTNLNLPTFLETPAAPPRYEGSIPAVSDTPGQSAAALSPDAIMPARPAGRARAVPLAVAALGLLLVVVFWPRGAQPVPAPEPSVGRSAVNLGDGSPSIEPFSGTSAAPVSKSVATVNVSMKKNVSPEAKVAAAKPVHVLATQADSGSTHRARRHHHAAHPVKSSGSGLKSRPNHEAAAHPSKSDTPAASDNGGAMSADKPSTDSGATPAPAPSGDTTGSDPGKP